MTRPAARRSAAQPIGVLGRALGWFVEGGVGSGLLELLVELGALVALILCIRGSRPPTGERSGGLRATLIAGAVLIAAAGGALALLFNATVEQWLFDGAAEQLAADVNKAPLADDAMRIAICGSSAPLPSARRAKACVAVFAGASSMSWTSVPSRSRV